MQFTDFCHACIGHPVWFLLLLLSFYSERGEAALRILGLSPEDSGVYTCVATNVAGSVTCSASLRVSGESPVINSLTYEQQLFPNKQTKSYLRSYLNKSACLEKLEVVISVLNSFWIQHILRDSWWWQWSFMEKQLWVVLHGDHWTRKVRIYWWNPPLFFSVWL